MTGSTATASRGYIKITLRLEEQGKKGYNIFKSAKYSIVNPSMGEG